MGKHQKWYGSYYPFGLTMAGISSKAAGSLENKYKYNGIELNEDLGVEDYDAHFRNLDPQTGRWWQIDPKCELAINPEVKALIEDQDYIESLEGISPYASMNDDPIKYKDPKGDIGDGTVEMGDPTARAAKIFSGTQKAALVVEAFGGGPENPVADFVAGAVEVVGGLVSLGVLAHDAITMNKTAQAAQGTKLEASNQGSGEGRGKNNRQPDPHATGDHTVSNDRGSTTYKKNDKHPSGFEESKRVDTKGKGHNGVETPHVHEKGEVRPAKPEDLPKSDLSKNKKPEGSTN